jgi:protein ImuA
MCGMSQPISSVKAAGLRIYKQQIYNRKRESDLTRLRHELAMVDGYDRRVRLPLGIDSLDRALAGGLALGRVHLLSGAMQTHGAVSGFTIALLCMLQNHLSVKKQTNNIHSINYPNQDSRPIIWCPASQRGGAGMLYGHGLAAAGLDPAHLLIVDTPSPSRRLTALDDILRTEGLAAVVIEYDGLKKSTDYWMRITRRAQLAAEQSGTTAFLLGAPIAASGFETAWHIKPAPNFATQSNPALVIHSAWDLTLRRARGGCPHICRASWHADSTSLQAIDQTDVSPDMPVKADLNIHVPAIHTLAI